MTYMKRDDITWCVLNEILDEDGEGHLIEKQHENFHLKWIISIRQKMIIAINIIDEHFCRQLFELAIFLRHNSLESVVYIFHFRLKTTTTTSIN